jgi:hypothetical protein
MQGPVSSTKIQLRKPASDRRGDGADGSSGRAGQIRDASLELLGAAGEIGTDSLRKIAQVFWISGVACGNSSESVKRPQSFIKNSTRADKFFSGACEIACPSRQIGCALTGNAALLTGFSRELVDAPPNRAGSRRDLRNRLAGFKELPKFLQDRARFSRTRRKIRQEISGKNRGISGIQTPVDRAQACSSKHPDGYREVPF